MPFCILRRLDCALESTKAAALAEHGKRVAQNLDPADLVTMITGYSFFNFSPLDMPKLLNDPGNIKANLAVYIGGLYPNVAAILEQYEFENRRLTASPSSTKTSARTVVCTIFFLKSSPTTIRP